MSLTKLFVLWMASLLTLTTIGCSREADVASRNLSAAADQFEVERRVVFYDSIQGAYLLSIEGKCSIEKQDGMLAVTCKTGANDYKKHYLGIADNVTFFAEQLQPAGVDVYHYRVVFRPQVIVPDVDMATGGR